MEMEMVMVSVTGCRSLSLIWLFDERSAMSLLMTRCHASLHGRCVGRAHRLMPLQTFG
jgi:hypothetical protein